MLSWVDSVVGHAWGPLRLLSSFFFLAGVGYATAAIATWVLLPRLWHRLPQDRDPTDGWATRPVWIS